MGQNKEYLTKLAAFVKACYDDPDNKEFAAGIQAIVLNDLQTSGPKEEWTKQINEIYELCLKRNLKEQAEDLYKDFTITEIAADLASLYIEMEDARRHNDFDAFGFDLYQQIELIVNTLIKGTRIPEIYEAIRHLEPFTVYDKNSRSHIRMKDKIYETVETFILIPKKGDGGELSYRSAGKSISGLTALEKARAVIYMVMLECDVDYYIDSYRRREAIEVFKTLSYIYNVRNHDAHSGGIITEYQTKQYEQLIANKTQNYLRFLGFLLQFVKGISSHYPISTGLFKLAGIAQ